MRKRLVDPNMLCMGCMTEFEYPMSVCPKCGFHAAAYQKPENSLSLYEIVNGKYLLGRVIGSGGFGITYIAWDFYQAKRICVKEYFPKNIAARNRNGHTYSEQNSVSLYCSQEAYTDPETYTQHMERVQSVYMRGLKAYLKEAKNLSRYFEMPGIVSIRDFFHENNTAYIAMEYIDGIDMKKYALANGGRLKPQEVFSTLQDVLIALDALHRDKIIHRDISPDNIMINKQRKAILIDFGAAKGYGNTKGPILLKHGYAPVEQYNVDGKQGPWTDIYSLCASIYYLLTGIRIPASLERKQHDTVQRLHALGIPISEKQDMAVWKGLKIEPEERYQTIMELYQDLYF